MKKLARGFTLIEVAVTILLIGVAASLFAVAHNTLSVTRNLSYDDVALRIANAELESLRTGGYGALPASDSFASPLLSELPDGSASTSITALNAKTKQVIVQVGWLQAGQVPRTLELATLITETGGL